MNEVWICELGTVDFHDALALQRRLCEARKADEVPDTLLLLEHPPVYTRGRRAGDADLPLGEDFYAARGIEVVEVDRGGLVTYHGPGQLVGYPIMRIGDVIGYLRTLERTIVAALAREGVKAGGAGDRPTGVWAGGRKIASIGVHVSRRVSTHGFAVNVDNDLQPFEWIVPCGLDGVAMTSLQAETGREGTLESFRASVIEEFALAFERQPLTLTPEQLSASLAAPVPG